MHKNPVVNRKNGFQVNLDQIGVGVARESKASPEPADVGVNGNAWASEDIGQDDIRGFSADAWQGLNLYKIVGHLSFKAFDQGSGGRGNIFGFVVMKIDLADIRLEFLKRGERHFFGGWVGFKQFFGCQIDADIGGLGA